MSTQAEISRHQERCNKTRKKLPDGPWMSEPDRVEFTEYGLTCLLVRNTECFNWCGYVGVPKGHPAFGQDYNNMNVDVHGGLTYGDHCRGAVCHIPNQGGDDSIYWLGFDCAHAFDLSPGLMDWADEEMRKMHQGYDEFKKLWRSREVYRDVNYVMNETKRLAKQLSQMK